MRAAADLDTLNPNARFLAITPMLQLENQSIEDVRHLCKNIVTAYGRTPVANKVGKSPQAVGKALQSHENEFKYLELRLAILRAYGFTVAGPFFTLTAESDENHL